MSHTTTFIKLRRIYKGNKNSAEVNIAPAIREITTACNVGQAKNGHDMCLKSESRTTTMQGFILTAIAAAERNALYF